MARGSFIKTSPNHPDRRVCCCFNQPNIEPEDIQRLATKEGEQSLMMNLRSRYDGTEDIMDIRRELIDSHIPFRHNACPRGLMVCCGFCSHQCRGRCPQDVMFRAHLYTDLIDPERLSEYPYIIQCLYKEMHPEEGEPQYVKIKVLIMEILDPQRNPDLERWLIEHDSIDNPNRLDYAPATEYIERIIRLPNGEEDLKVQKKVDPKTGNVCLVEWPRSGVCPFCWPNHTTDRRRTAGTGYKRGPRIKRTYDNK